MKKQKTDIMKLSLFLRKELFNMGHPLNSINVRDKDHIKKMWKETLGEFLPDKTKLESLCVKLDQLKKKGDALSSLNKEVWHLFFKITDDEISNLTKVVDYGKGTFKIYKDLLLHPHKQEKVAKKTKTSSKIPLKIKKKTIVKRK